MSTSATLTRRVIRSGYPPSSSCIATCARLYSAAAAAEKPHEDISSPSNSSLEAPAVVVPSAAVEPIPQAEAAPAKKLSRPISWKRRAAYEAAKSKAEALRRSILHGDPNSVKQDEQTGPVASSSALSPTKSKVEQSPTLETLEKYRPEKPANPFGPRYKQRYEKVWWSITNAFLRKQLFKLAKEMGFRGSNRMTTKDDLIDYILRSWEWRPVAEVEAEVKARQEAKRPVDRVIPLSHMEMFVLLRKSPRVLTDIAERHDLTISMSQAPELGLRANGTAMHIAHLETVLQDMRKTIVHEYFAEADVGGVKARWLPAVAEMTGAFIEAIPGGMFKISSTGGRQAENAKELLRSAWTKNVDLPQRRPLLSASPVVAKPLAMYPFLPAPMSTMEWDAPTTPLFRVRTVGSWFALPKAPADLHSIDTVRSRESDLPKELEAVLTKPMEGPARATRRISAKFGHILHTAEDDAAASLLTPPLQGQWRLEALQQWAAAGTSIFTPGVPPSYSQTSPPSLATATRHRQLLYREVGSDKFFALDVDYPPPKAQGPVEPKADWAAELDMLLEGLEDVKVEQSELEPDLETVVPKDLSVSARCGLRSEVDVMMPDRAVDVRFAVEEAADMDENVVPPQFEAFIRQLSCQGDADAAVNPPRTVNLQLHGKASYELIEDVDVERVSQGSFTWWTTKKDMLTGGFEAAPELVIEGVSGDTSQLLTSVAEASNMAYGPPPATDWNAFGSS